MLAYNQYNGAAITIWIGKFGIYSPLETVSETHIMENIRLKEILNILKIKTLNNLIFISINN